MNKPIIVKFEDGNYAIRRRGLFGFKYLFLPDEKGKTWEEFNSDLFIYCKSRHLHEVKNRIDYGTPI